MFDEIEEDEREIRRLQRGELFRRPKPKLPEQQGDVMERREHEHSPLPWRVGGSFSEFIISNVGIEPSVARATGITRDEAEANARFIVKCVNQHTALVEQRDRCIEALREVRRFLTKQGIHHGSSVCMLIDTALAIVEQEEGRESRK